jgi:hypothetical protein
MSFVLFLFHLFVFLIMLPRSICGSIFHDGCWVFKFILVIGAYIGVFWIPNSFYFGWAHFARIASGLYLFLQVILLIITAFMLNDILVKSYEESGSCCSMVTLLGFSGLLTAGIIVFIVFQFIWFSGCGGSLAIVIVTLIFIIAFYVLNLIKTREDGSVFTASIVSSYCAYLGWSAMASIPDEQCNPFVTS